ncbi:MAG: hypothetical protein KDK00_07940 [Rhodobacteraceae bacterium]|nr:hypothetical protein [Paracoccaceae bacterium]
MTKFLETLRILTLTAGVALGLVAAASGGALADCPVLLTVTGKLDNPNRGGFDADADKFFGYYDVEFDKARSFSCVDLDKLTPVSVRADFPAGKNVHTYDGVLLADVLAAAGATGDKVTVQALDGYAVEVSLAEMVEKGAVVALKRDGESFGIGGFGPTQIVFPRADRADLKDMNDDWWVWSIFHIRVE